MEKDIHKVLPESLALIEEIVNTHYGPRRPDEWQSSAQTRAWLIEHQLLAPHLPLTQGDQRRLLEVREALRNLLRSNSGASMTSEQIETLNHFAAHAPSIVQFCRDGQAHLVPDIEGVDGVISQLMSNTFTAMQDDTWIRLKICRNEPCRKAFYDNSKNHSGTWCSMATCGSRRKARNYRERQQHEPHS